MKLLKEITNEDIGEKLKAKKFKRFRQAARAVIFDSEGKVALLFVSKSNYHKLPGGGMEESETPEQALIREAREEIGCEVEIINELGRVIEYKEFEDTGALKQESFGYVAKVIGEKGKHVFTKEEEDLGFEPVEWYEIDKAISILESDQTEIYQGKFVLIRDLLFLKEAAKKAGFDHVAKTTKVYEKLGQSYIESVASGDWPEVKKFIELVGSGRILDAGCTGGRDSKKLLEAGFSVIGIDLVEEFLDSARKNCKGGEFKKMDLRRLDFRDDYFDGIWASMVLLHLTKEECLDVLGQLSRVLKSDGYLFVGMKAGEFEGYKGDPLTPGKKRFFRYYLKEEFEAMLEKNNFEIVSSIIKVDILGRNQQVMRILARNKK